jgi:hypothetical protein
VWVDEKAKNTRKNKHRGGLIVGEKVMSSITDDRRQLEAGLIKLKGVDELTTVITKTVVSGKNAPRKYQKDNTSETETFNKELLKTQRRLKIPRNCLLFLNRN